MLRRTTLTSFLKMLAVLAMLSLVAGLLMACGDEEDSNNDNSNGNQGGTEPTATVAPLPPTQTATPPKPATDDPTSTPAETPPSQPVTPVPTITPDFIEHPTGADETIIRIDYEGGFVPQQHLLTRMPVFLLDGRGCIITQGPMIEIYPQPALPNLQETCLQEEGVQYFLMVAKEAGLLDGDAHYPMDMLSDATTTVFTVNAEGRTVRVSAYGLAEGSDEYITGKDAEQQKAARKKLSEFLVRIGELEGWIPPNNIISVEQPHAIKRMQIVSLPTNSPYAPQGGEPLEQQEQAWPLEGSLGEFGTPYFIDDYRCGVLEGVELGRVVRALAEANQATPWVSGDGRFYLYVRPLLAGEEGCPEPAM